MIDYVVYILVGSAVVSIPYILLLFAERQNMWGHKPNPTTDKQSSTKV